MCKAVVFDLDGTLLDTVPDIAGALNRALSACGLPTHPVRAFEGFIGGGIRSAVLKATPPDTSGETIDQVLEVYRTAYLEHCTEKTAPYPGVREMLTSLAERGIILGVLSNKTEATAQKIICHFFPEIPFRFVFGRAPGRPLKPDAGAAAPVLAELELPAEEIAYVGDSDTDMVFARAVGMLAVAAPWGYRSREELAQGGAERMPDNPAVLAEVLLTEK